MRRRNAIALSASVALVLVMVLSGCGTAQEDGGGGIETYRALSPLGMAPSIELVTMPPRIDTMEGKTILITYSESDPIVMPEVVDQMKTTYPTVNWIVKGKSGPSYDTTNYLTEEELAQGVDAAITGLSY